jgi:hypothetical protein
VQHRADTPGPDGVSGASAQNTDGPRRGGQQAEDGVDDRGLAGSVGAEQGHRGTCGDGEVETVDGDGLAVPEGQSGYVQGGGSGHAISVFRRPRPEVVQNVARST